MRFLISRGVVFSYVFLAIIAVSHAFVFWIPIWKTTTVLRYQPKKGWYPVKTSGSAILKKPNTYYPFHSPSHHQQRHLHKPHHHFRSTFRHPYHHKYHVHTHAPVHKYKGWKPANLLNLNHHHPLCPLCHVAAWNKYRKPYHRAGHGQPFFRIPRNHYFSPSNAFPKFHHSPGAGFFNDFPKHKPFYYPGIHHSPKPIHYGKFGDFSSKFQDFNKYSSNYQHQPYSYPKTNHHPKAGYHRASSAASELYNKLKNYPSISHAPPKSSSLQFPKDFSNFGFNGFGSGKRGHGWEGWDW